MEKKLQRILLFTFLLLLATSVFIYQSKQPPKGFDRKITQDRKHWFTKSTAITEKDGCVDFIDSKNLAIHVCGSYQIEPIGK